MVLKKPSLKKIYVSDGKISLLWLKKMSFVEFELIIIIIFEHGVRTLHLRPFSIEKESLFWKFVVKLYFNIKDARLLSWKI